MKPSSSYLLFLFIILAAVLAGYIVAGLPQPPDQQQISDQIAALANAARHDDVGGIMNEISDTYTDSNVADVEQLQLLIQRHTRDIGDSDIVYGIQNTDVTGSTATSTVQVTATDPVSHKSLYNRTITLTWKKESGHRYLVIPAKIWRITSADYGTAFYD